MRSGVILWCCLVFTSLCVAAAVLRALNSRRSALARARHERAVAQAESESRRHFLATLSHEVRTPMTGVLGMSELLMAETLAPHHHGWAAAIHQAGQHLLRLVDDALDLARLEAGCLPLAVEPFDLHGLLRELDAMHAPLAAQRGLAWRIEVAAGVPLQVVGDSRRLRQVLLNLLGNALKFTTTGSFGLRATGDAGALAFVVEDTGPGMDARQQARLFRRFEQADGARTATRFGGSGLGLAISQELVEAMGGSITVDSAPGTGTRFQVRLPLASAPAVAVHGLDQHADVVRIHVR